MEGCLLFVDCWLVRRLWIVGWWKVVSNEVTDEREYFFFFGLSSGIA